MTIGLIFWVLMLLWLVFGLWASGPWPHAAAAPSWGNHLFLFILLLLVGWALFGAPVRG